MVGNISAGHRQAHKPLELPSHVVGLGGRRGIEFVCFDSYHCRRIILIVTMTPNPSPEPMPDGAGYHRAAGSAVAVHVTRKAWLSFFRLAALSICASC